MGTPSDLPTRYPRRMSDAPDTETIASHVEALDSDDAFVRREAIEWLARVTRRRHDFDWRADADERAPSLARWRDWLERRRRRERTERLGNTLEKLTGGQLDPKALSQLVAGLDDPSEAQAVKALIAQLAAAQAAPPPRPICEACSGRPATVELVRRTADGWVGEELCEPCASARGL